MVRMGIGVVVAGSLVFSLGPLLGTFHGSVAPFSYNSIKRHILAVQETPDCAGIRVLLKFPRGKDQDRVVEK